MAGMLLGSCLIVNELLIFGMVVYLIRYLGKRAYRRPLTDNEVRQYAGLFSSSSTFEESAELMLTTMSMLVSPYFLYRSELGVEQAHLNFQHF